MVARALKRDAVIFLHCPPRLRGLPHASALCCVLVEYAGKSGHGERIALLLEFFESLRFRCHLQTMDNLVSKVSYLIQRDRLLVKEQETLVQMCLSALQICDQMSSDDWFLGRALDPVERVECVVKYGLTVKTRRSAEGKVLLSLLRRSKQMLQRIRRMRANAAPRNVGDGRAGKPHSAMASPKSKHKRLS